MTVSSFRYIYVISKKAPSLVCCMFVMKLLGKLLYILSSPESYDYIFTCYTTDEVYRSHLKHEVTTKLRLIYQH